MIIRGIIKSIEEKLAKNNKPYLNIKFKDQNRIDYNVKDWDCKTKAMGFKECDTVDIIGEKDTYNNYEQFILKEIAPVVMDKSVFIETLSEEEINGYYDKIISQINSIYNEDGIRDWLLAIYETYKKEIKYGFAAIVNHHNYVGGLVQHISEVVDYALMSSFANMSSSNNIFLDIDFTVVLAGALLHDMGKILIYYGDKGFIDYKDNLKVFGEIPITLEFIKKHIPNILTNEEKEKIGHILYIVASHHGSKEYGSLCETKTKEAILVHHADKISADFNKNSKLKETKINFSDLL